MDSIWEKFTKMYREKSQIALLTWAYVTIAAAVVIISGLIALINQSVGVSVLIVPLVSIVAMCANIVVWSLIRFILDMREQKEKAKTRAVKRSSEKTKK